MKGRGKLYCNAVGVIEIILILVILVGLVLIFKGEIETMVSNAVKALTGKTNKII